MSTSIQLDFNLSQDIVLQDFEAKRTINPIFDLIVVQNVPNPSSGLELIRNDQFNQRICQLPNVFGIILKTNVEIDDKFEYSLESFYFQTKTSFLLAFQSNIGQHGAKIFWKSLGNSEFYSLNVDGDVADMVCNFLLQEIKAGRSGIMGIRPDRMQIRLHKIGEGQNSLLNIAVNKCQNEVVRSLLKYDFVADDVIDLAWNLFLTSDDSQKPLRSQIVLTLLEANSKLPNNFEYDRASREIQGFIKWCEYLQKDVDKEDLNSLKLKLDSRPNVNCFYDRTNQSLFAYAIKKKKSTVYKTFVNRLNTGNHEDIANIYQTIHWQSLEFISQQRIENPYNFPHTHLFVLKSKTKISSNDQNAHEHWEYIEEAYEKINSIEYCSKILKVAAECKDVRIFFDFKNVSTYYLDPATDTFTQGVICEGGTIFIGAKDLLDENKKFDVFGVVAHELCHLAVYMSFMNRNFDPFPTGESELKTRFIDRVMVQCKRNEKRDRTIKNVFNTYLKEVQDSEMIVTYPEILMKYFGNNQNIEQFERNFDELVNYSKEVVEPELDRALKVLKWLNDEQRLIKFNDLTVSMKARILNSEIFVQGVETTLLQLVGDNEEILNALTSENIREILLKNKTIDIGEAIKLDMEYGIIPRNFQKVLAENQVDENDNGESSRKKRKLNKPKTELRTFEEVRDEANNSKIFLLADHAGSGKTTIFKDCTKKLKEFYKNSWVSFINLRKHYKVYDAYQNKTDALTLDDVAEILQKIVNPKPSLEESIYKKLFLEGRVIFLFDGVDEISPIYTKLLLKIFTILCQMQPKNEMWISTRLHYAQVLSDALKIPYHKFTQYKGADIKNFIVEILKFRGIKNEQEQKKKLSNINNCLKGLKGKYYESKEIENPLMVQMVTELYIEKLVNPENISRFGVYEAMVEKQKEKVGEKIPNTERDKDFSLNIWDVHRVLALILIVGDDYEKELKFKLKDLQLMQKWKEEKHKRTPDMIQRYGLVIVDLSSENVDRSSIDFMHRTYAEFFVAQIFLKFITNDNNDIYNNSKIGDILLAIMKRTTKFFIVKDFILSFIKDKISKNERINLDNMKNYVLDEFKYIHYQVTKSSKIFLDRLKSFKENFLDIAKCIDSEILDTLWKLDKEHNLLEEYFKFNDMKYDGTITECAEKYFGSSWHETFNKSGTKLITHEEILKFKKDNMDDSQWNNSKNLLKFCDLLDKNYEIEARKKFYKKMDAIHLGVYVYGFDDYVSDETHNEIISRARNTFDRNEFCENFFLNANLYLDKPECVKQILSIIDNDFLNDEDLHRKLLFQNPERSKCPLCQYLRDDLKAKEKFILIKDFYIKHKSSWKDIQDLLVNVDFKNFLSPIRCSYYAEYKELIKDAFGTDFSRLVTKIDDFFDNGGEIDKLESHRKERAEDFLNLIYSNDTEKVKTMIYKITERE